MLFEAFDDVICVFFVVAFLCASSCRAKYSGSVNVVVSVIETPIRVQATEHFLVEYQQALVHQCTDNVVGPGMSDWSIAQFQVYKFSLSHPQCYTSAQVAFSIS